MICPSSRTAPLTYRTYDRRRKARHVDTLSLFNRVKNSQVRIGQLETLKRDLLLERARHRQARHGEYGSCFTMLACYRVIGLPCY